MFSHIVAGGRAAFNLFLAALLGVVIGGLLATPPDDETAPVTPTTTVAQVTPEEVARLADALEALTTTTVPPEAEPLVAEARDVLEDVREQGVDVRTTPPVVTTEAPVQTTAPYPPAAPVTTIPTTTAPIQRGWDPPPGTTAP